jgi:hypothetical protein
VLPWQYHEPCSSFASSYQVLVSLPWQAYKVLLWHDKGDIRLALVYNTQAIQESYSENSPKAHEKSGLLNASQFCFLSYHSTTPPQCMRLTDHVILNFNNNMSTAAVFLDTEKTFKILWYKWHLGLLYKLSNLKFLISLIKLISLLGEISTPSEIHAGVLQGSILSPTLYSIFINDTPQTPGVYLGLFADDTSKYMRWITRRIVFSESCSKVSLLLRCGAWARI